MTLPLCRGLRPAGETGKPRPAGWSGGDRVLHSWQAVAAAWEMERITK